MCRLSVIVTGVVSVVNGRDRDQGSDTSVPCYLFLARWPVECNKQMTSAGTNAISLTFSLVNYCISWTYCLPSWYDLGSRRVTLRLHSKMIVNQVVSSRFDITRLTRVHLIRLLANPRSELLVERGFILLSKQTYLKFLNGSTPNCNKVVLEKWQKEKAK